MLQHWLERLRTMGFLFCYLIILQFLCSSIASNELHQHDRKMFERFNNSSNNVLQSIWRAEPSNLCNIPKPSELNLQDKTFLAFYFNEYLCVILYDTSLRYSKLQINAPHHDPGLVQKIIENSPSPQGFCQKMKENAWSTYIEENKNWLMKFNDMMNNKTLCARYCVSDFINPLCAYVLWLDSSIKEMHQDMPPVSLNDPSVPLPYSKKIYHQQPQPHPPESLETSVRKLAHDIQAQEHGANQLTEKQHNVESQTPISVNSLVAGKDSPYSVSNLPASTVTDSNKSGHSPPGILGPNEKDSHVSSQNNKLNAQFASQPYPAPVDEVPEFNLKRFKPPVLNLGNNVHNPSLRKDNMAPVLSQGIETQPSTVVSSSAATDTNSQKTLKLNTHINDMLHGDKQYTKTSQQVADVQNHAFATDGGNNLDLEDDKKLKNDPNQVLKPDNVNSVTPESKLKQTSGGTTINKEGKDMPPETKPPRPSSGNEDSNHANEGISDVALVAEPDNHEKQRAMEEAEGRDDGESIAEHQDEQSPEIDGVPTSEPRFGEENDDPLKPNPSPKVQDYGDELSDEDLPNTINAEQEKVTQNDADVGIYVHDRFVDAEDSHFFAYFMTMIILCIIGYLIFHNKQKILALALEGRARKGNRRRPSTSGYRKLDSNLEEAVTSNCSGATVTHVIY